MGPDDILIWWSQRTMPNDNDNIQPLGLVLVTHGRLAEELKSVMEHVVGRTAIVVNIIDLKPDESIPKIRQNLGACDKLLPEMNTAAGIE